MANYGKTPAAKLMCWQAMRCLEVFSVADLVGVTELPERTVYDYVKGLLKVDYLAQESAYDPQGERGNRATYRLVKDTGLYAPVFKAGEVVDPNLQPKARDKVAVLWQLIRMQRRVDAGHLAAVTEQSATPVSRYLKFLSDNDLLMVQRRNASGKAASWVTYRLVRDPGPLPPIRRRDGSLLDLNKVTKRIKERCRGRRLA